MEATNVAGLLGSDATLRLGAEAREAELKTVVSPRVLHLATHGFYFPDQEFKQTNGLNIWTLRLDGVSPHRAKIGKIRWCVAALRSRREPRAANHERDCRGRFAHRLGSVVAESAGNGTGHLERL